MPTKQSIFAVARVGFVVAATFGAATPGEAAPQDYRFEIVGAPRTEGGADIVQLRLLHVADNTPVLGALLFQGKAVMGEGAGAMAAPVTILPSERGDLLRISVVPGMAGPWSLVLAARVQGEPAIVRGTVNVELSR